MATLKDYSLGAVIGMTVAAMINLGIFATKADIAELKADIAMQYVRKDEIAPTIYDLQRDVRRIMIKLGVRDADK